jgi:hypothetical protein
MSERGMEEQVIYTVFGWLLHGFTERAEKLLAAFCKARMCEPNEVSEAIYSGYKAVLIRKCIEENPEEAKRAFMRVKLTS